MRKHMDKIVLTIIVASFLWFSYNNEAKQVERIAELEEIIEQNRFQPILEDTKEYFDKARVALGIAYRTLGDSLKVDYRFADEPIEVSDGDTHLNFYRSFESKLTKPIAQVLGELLIRDSLKQNIIKFQVEIEPDNADWKTKDGVYTESALASYYLNSYHPAIRELFLDKDSRDFSIKWELKEVVFTDSTAIRLSISPHYWAD